MPGLSQIKTLQENKKRTLRNAPGGMRLLERRITRLILLRRAAVCLLTASMAILLSGCGQDNSGAQNQSVTDADAARFLEQATWGPNETGIREVQQKGLEQFLNEQFVALPSSLGAYPIMDTASSVGCPASLPNAGVCRRDNYSVFPLQIRFFQNALGGRDQLRQRVAFALSQIFVVSAKVVNQPYALAQYQELLAKHSFGNFRDILHAVTLSPAMGRYLNMANNTKENLAGNATPNENYARELLQLFSIGVFKLNTDGTPRRGSAGRPIPAYDQDTIEGFSRVFTGWTYPEQPGSATQQALNPPYYSGQMVVVENNHDTDSKKLLDGVMLPAGQMAKRDLDDAINNIFNHPNVGPFIGRQLIQHLVTSNPSPAYVSRVAGAFNSDAQGVRGDMKAVIREILLDPEARGDEKTSPGYGKLREPVKFIAGILRALDGKSDGIFPSSQSTAMGQGVYSAPSVFNFYPRDYPLQGTSLVSPVSAIYTATTALSRANFVHFLLYNNDGIAPDPTVSGAIGTKVNLPPLAALADDPEKLMNKLNLVMMHSNMSSDMRNVIIQAINVIPPNDPATRVRTAVYLVASSPQYQVER
jgi:uncharacterized protein (DUF1800 family)